MNKANEVCKLAIRTYGLDNQLFQLDEELAELIQAVNKWRRHMSISDKYEAYKQDVAEEIADVQIMLEQLMMIVNISEQDVTEWKDLKIHRLCDRIKNKYAV